MAKPFDPRKVLKHIANALLREFFTRRGELLDVTSPVDMVLVNGKIAFRREGCGISVRGPASKASTISESGKPTVGRSPVPAVRPGRGGSFRIDLETEAPGTVTPAHGGGSFPMAQTEVRS